MFVIYIVILFCTGLLNSMQQNLILENSTVNEMLGICSETGDLKGFRYYKAQGADINSTELNGLTPLDLASWNNNLEIVREILTYPNIDIKRLNKFKQTPFLRACQRGLIIKNIIDQQYTDQETYNKIENAKYNYFVNNQIIKLFLNRSDLDLDQVDSFGMTALLYQAEQNNTEIVIELLKKGASLFVFNRNRQNLFHILIRNQNLILFNFLLHNCDKSLVNKLINLDDELGITPLNQAIIEEKIIMINILLQYPGILIGAKELFNFVKSHNLQGIQYLIYKEFDINTTIKKQSVLHVIANIDDNLTEQNCTNYLRCFNELLKWQNLDLTLEDENEKTVLEVILEKLKLEKENLNRKLYVKLYKTFIKKIKNHPNFKEKKILNLRSKKIKLFV